MLIKPLSRIIRNISNPGLILLVILYLVTIDKDGQDNQRRKMKINPGWHNPFFPSGIICFRCPI